MSDDLVLDIHDDSEIKLPAEIANSTLSLAQIGAIVCLAALTSDVDVSPERMGSPEMKAALDELRAAGVVEAKVAGGGVKIAINLEKAMP